MNSISKNLSPQRMNLNEKCLRYHVKSLKYLEKNELEKAQKQLENLMQVNYKPGVFEVLTLNNLAVVYVKQKSYSKAMAVLLKALVKAKSQGSVQHRTGTLFNLSATASNLGAHTDSLSYALKAIKLLLKNNDFKNLPLAYYNAAITTIYLGRVQEAEDLLKKSLNSIEKGGDKYLQPVILKTLSQILSRKSRENESQAEKPKTKFDLTSRKKVVLKKHSSHELIKGKNIEKNITRPAVKKTDSNVSSRKFSSAGKKVEKTYNSSASSSESIKNSTKLHRQSSSTKFMRKNHSEKDSRHSNSSNGSLHNQVSEYEFGNRIQNIGDHLNSIEKKLNDFVALCKPLKILTEDPDEQLESYRMTRCNLKAIIYMQRLVRKRFYVKTISAIKIQRAYRKHKSKKQLKSLLKFKDNPLFKQPSSVKHAKNKARKNNCLHN